ncbi:MAG: pyridoxal-phosphate dependent enzyme [Candidatus Rokubacteria bacterium]|nr:pyridoxal-phosphate dependent enzyme [Candidatus Rokubacteria bacterium]
MIPEARIVGLQCLRCRSRYGEPRLFAGCPRCREAGVAVNLTVEYDYAPLAGLTAAAIPAAPRGLWRFRGLLPVRPEHPISLDEGDTPLVRLTRLGARLGLPNLYAKDESRNPTWSYKDRLCALAVNHAVAIGARVITISSTGNHGASTAAYAARAGLPCVIFTLASVPDTMKTLMQAYGAAVVECPTSESRWALMREGVERLGWYPTSGFVMPPVGSNPWGVEGYKTIAYETAEALGWAAPDLVVVPSAYSDGLSGIWKGWAELQTLGLVKTAPRMLAAEPFGPLASALERGLDAPETVDAPGSSVAFSIASRYGTWQGLAALRESGGIGVRITDEGIYEAQRALGREEGLFVEPSSATSLTAVMQLKARGELDPNATIVIVLTSSGLKDPGASRAWLPPVPAADASFDRLLVTLREHYGLTLDR